MNIEPIHDGLLRVWLTEDELQQWGLLDPVPDRRQVRRLVRRILVAAQHRSGGVTAELIPVAGGGVLLITSRQYPEVGLPAVYRLVDEDALLALWERWPAYEAAPLCALYALEEEYRLAVYPDEPLSPQQTHLLLEYGTPLTGGEGAVAHAAEYGTLVGMGALFTANGPRPPAPSDPER